MVGYTAGRGRAPVTPLRGNLGAFARLLRAKVNVFRVKPSAGRHPDPGLLASAALSISSAHETSARAISRRRHLFHQRESSTSWSAARRATHAEMRAPASCPAVKLALS